MTDRGAEPEGRGRGIVLALLSAAGFSTLGLFARLIYAEGFSLQAALAWRFTTAGIALWIIVFATARPMPARPLRLVLLGFVGFAPQAGLYFATVRILDPGITGLLLYLYPSFVVVIAFAVFRRKPGLVRLAAVALSLAGSVITFWKAGNYPLVGIGLGIFMAVFYATYLVVGERILAEADPLVASAVVMTAAAVTYWLASIATGDVRLPATPTAIAGVLGVALFATLVPVTTLYTSMRIIGSTDASLVSTLEPVLTIVWSAMLLGERFGPAQIVGGSLIILSVLAIDLAPRIVARGRPAPSASASAEGDSLHPGKKAGRGLSGGH